MPIRSIALLFSTMTLVGEFHRHCSTSTTTSTTDRCPGCDLQQAVPHRGLQASLTTFEIGRYRPAPLMIVPTTEVVTAHPVSPARHKDMV
eukprot:3618778-Rhodomonas_salina.2